MASSSAVNDTATYVFLMTRLSEKTISKTHVCAVINNRSRPYVPRFELRPLILSRNNCGDSSLALLPTDARLQIPSTMLNG